MNVSSFDPKNKLDWFNADLNGFIHTFAAVTAVLVLLGVATYAVVTSLTSEQLVVATISLSGLLSFVIVFCLRRNLTVIGERRQFRYFCRWL